MVASLWVRSVNNSSHATRTSGFVTSQEELSMCTVKSSISAISSKQIIAPVIALIFLFF